ncbi:hypothetical protein E2562_024527 [Oryza meyeriana var. granulata]|uniref:Uncharacterized protein n=2 Tax=Oryza meyeriana var. granulata TaxID=110450 RepID=A0A6G1BM89_9ORYZ|nr:hypothetical protein E2562_024527 [Oryza meyeriana var. granulata]
MEGKRRSTSPCIVLGVGDTAITVDAAAVVCCECSPISKGRIVLSSNLDSGKGIGLNLSHEIVNVDLELSDMTCTFGLTFTCDVLCAAFCWLDKEIDNAEVVATYCIVLQHKEMYPGPCCLQLLVTAFSPCVYSTCYANKGSNTASFNTAADVAVTKVNRKYGNIVTDVAARPLQTLHTTQLADEKGGLMANAPCEITSATEYTCPLELQSMLKEEYVDHYKLFDRLVAKMFPMVARVKKPVSSSEVDAEFGVAAYSKHGTRTLSPLLRVLKPSQVWVLFLVILLSVSPVHSFTHDESAEIGTCRFDKTSVATLSCKQPDGKWRPPSVTCCNALLNAIDHLPASNERGACCLCRYLHLRYPNDGHGLVSSYVLCQGKDRHIVTTWSSFPIGSCHTVCGQEKASSSGMSNPVQKNHPVGNVHRTGISSLEPKSEAVFRV